MKVALITGASGGIGKATVKKFIKEGYFVVGQYNSDTDSINALKKELVRDELGDYFFAVQADLSNAEQIQALINRVTQSFKCIDVLVNNAGVGLYKLITETTEEEWDKLFAINMKGAYLLTNGMLKGMIDKKYGKIINVSSIWGNVGASMEVAYSASKAALIGYTKALAKELAPSKITVNCVCPGVIDTPINARFSIKEMQALKEETPIGRIGKAEEVAELIYFLSTEKSDFITGQIITCDGGFTL